VFAVFGFVRMESMGGSQATGVKDKESEFAMSMVVTNDE
jgi:hypothetical protein